MNTKLVVEQQLVQEKIAIAFRLGLIFLNKEGNRDYPKYFEVMKLVQDGKLEEARTAMGASYAE